MHATEQERNHMEMQRLFLVLEAIGTNSDARLQPIYRITQRLPLVNNTQSKRNFYNNFGLYDPTDPAIFKGSVVKGDAYFWQVLVGESHCRPLGFGDKVTLSP